MLNMRALGKQLGIDWLLDCEPRPAQIEALCRSYTGFTYREHKDHDLNKEALAHKNQPAGGWGHFLEMRVGKTPTALNEFMLFKRDYGLNKFFMLSPNKYKYTWATEMNKFGVDIPVHVFESSNRDAAKRFINSLGPEGGALIVNYEALIYPENNAIFESFIDDRTYMGADEAVMIKNRESTFFKNSFDLSKNAAVTRPMTGKPTPQGVSDLYSQLRFARKLNGMNFFQFRAKFALMGGFKGRLQVGVKNEEELHKIARQSYFFARRRDWGTQIDCDYERRKVGMTPEQKKAYQTMEEEFCAWLDSGEMVTVEQVITKHIKLQQISSGFILDENGVAHDIVSFTKTPKFMDLIDTLENEVSCKVIIPFHYNVTGDRLVAALQKFNPAIIRGNEAMKKAKTDSESEKHKFNNNPSCRIMIAQGNAVKYGHTLMGTKTDPCLATFFFENSYSLDTRAQVEERNQGEGQLDAIHVLDYYSSPVERKIISALQRKEQVAAKIMGYYKGGDDGVED